MSSARWIAALLGALLVWWLATRGPRTEAFTTGTGGGGTGTGTPGTGGSGTDTGTPGTDTTVPPWQRYVEASVPFLEDLRVYLTSFSAFTTYAAADGTPTPVYASGTWNNFVSPDGAFTLLPTVGATPPAALRNGDVDIGVSIKGLKLIGPTSAFLGAPVGSSTQVQLGSFTAAFYGVLETVDFARDANAKTLFRIFAETPATVELSVRKRDATNSYVVALVGGSAFYSWNVANAVLTSNGNPTLYAVVYAVGSSTQDTTITFHIGRTKFSAVVEPAGKLPKDILLGNSEAVLNPAANVDLKLVAHAFYTRALSDADVKTLADYFAHEMSGISMRLQDAAAQEDARRRQLADLEDLLAQLNGDLSTCQASATAPDANAAPKRHWQIRTPDGIVGDVTDDDLAQCVPLKVSAGGPPITQETREGGAPDIPYPDAPRRK